MVNGKKFILITALRKSLGVKLDYLLFFFRGSQVKILKKNAKYQEAEK